jgi:hypothetical protein
MRALVVLAAVAASASGCGTTHVLTQDATARVYVDGAMVGKGHGTVSQRGFPGSAHLLAKSEDGRRKSATVSRSFTGVTLLLGFVTSGICWIACWEYPSSVVLDLPPAPGTAGAAPAGGLGVPATTPGVDPWLQPPPGWRPRGEAAAPEPPPPAPAPAQNGTGPNT